MYTYTYIYIYIYVCVDDDLKSTSRIPTDVAYSDIDVNTLVV